MSAPTPPPVPVLQLLGPSAGGIRRHVASLADGLERRGWPVAVAGPSGVLDGLRRLDHVVEVPSARLGAGGGLASAWRGRSAVGVLAAEAGLVHAHGLKAGWLAATSASRVPVVVTVHNLVLAASAGAATGALRALEAALPARVDATIVVSAAMARRFTGVAGAGRVRVVAPVSTPPQPAAPVAATRARLGAAPGVPLVVCVGRLHAQKGLDVLLGATAVLERRGLRLRLALVGDGPLEVGLRRHASALGLDDTVVLPGASANAADELAAADVVAVPSRWEGWPLVVSEALQLGRPVVASAVGGVPDMIDATTGWLVEPGDVLGLAAALAGVLADPAAAAATARGQGRALLDRYPPPSLLGEVEAVYRAVLAPC